MMDKKYYYFSGVEVQKKLNKSIERVFARYNLDSLNTAIFEVTTSYGIQNQINAIKDSIRDQGLYLRNYDEDNWAYIIQGENPILIADLRKFTNKYNESINVYWG